MILFALRSTLAKGFLTPYLLLGFPKTWNVLKCLEIFFNPQLELEQSVGHC